MKRKVGFRVEVDKNTLIIEMYRLEPEIQHIIREVLSTFTKVCSGRATVNLRESTIEIRYSDPNVLIDLAKYLNTATAHLCVIASNIVNAILEDTAIEPITNTTPELKKPTYTI